MAFKFRSSLLMHCGVMLIASTAFAFPPSVVQANQWHNGIQFLSNLLIKTDTAEIVSAADHKQLPPKKYHSYAIRVLLDEMNKDFSWTVQACKGLMLSSHETSRKKRYGDAVLEFAYKNGFFMINGVTIKEKMVRVDPLEGHNILYQGREYQGSLLFIIDQEHCFIINQIDLEDYVYAVLKSESWPGWPLEVNKAFAIASRSYALVKYLEAKKTKKPYHIKNTNAHQTYNGFHTNYILKRAVEETAGLILTHNKKPIIAMFDCCCGDVIPAHLNTIDFKKAPYLARKVPCTFCKSSKIYQWKLEFDSDEFQTIISSSGIVIEQIRDVYVSKKDKAGAVEEIIIQDRHQHHSLTGKQFYALFSKVKSFCYSIAKKGKKIYITGKGYGHHLGICQWGARNMINYGWSYRSILQFYYPGTHFMKLTSVC